MHGNLVLCSGGQELRVATGPRLEMNAETGEVCIVRRGRRPIAMRAALMNLDDGGAGAEVPPPRPGAATATAKDRRAA